MPTADAAFPEVLTKVVLHAWLPDGTSADLPTRVCDVEYLDGFPRVVVDRPDLSALAEPGAFPHRGDELRLVWARPSDQMQMPVTAVAANRPYGPVWVLTPIGPPKREQRREYLRVPLTAPAMLTQVVEGDDTERPPVRASLVEIGEGGVLVSCDSGLPDVGTLVELSFTLEDRTITAQGEVLRHDVPSTGRPCAAVRFLDPTAHGDHIRRVAFAVQRAMARARLG